VGSNNLKVYNENSESEFSKLITKNLETITLKENSIVTGTIEKIDDKFVHVFIKGAKSSGLVDKNEIPHAERNELKEGNDIEVFLERTEDKNGNIVLSIEKARRSKSWEKIKEAFEKKENVSGMLRNTVKGGLVCEIMGVMAFVPNSQLDTKPVKNIREYLDKPLEFRIIKIDEIRFNVIASRREIIEEEKNKNKEKVIKNYKVGDIVEGTIKAVQSYGCFVSIESLDCLLHSSEVSHLKISNLNDMFNVGEKVKVKILEIDKENMRMSLSVKAMLPDPFETMKDKFIIGNEYDVKIKKLTDFGAFAEMSEGVVGLIHSSEIKHMQKNVNPKSVFKINDVIKVKLKEVDIEKRKIGLSYKDCLPNPIDEFISRYPSGSTVEAKVITKQHFGIFCNTGDSDLEKIDIFVHYKQLDYNESSKALDSFKKGDKVKIKIIDIKDEKVNGSIRALKRDPYSFFDGKKIGDIVSTRVVEVLDNGLKVDVGPERYQVIIRKSELALEKSDQRPNRFSSGDSIDAAILEIDPVKRKVKLSVKYLEQKEKDLAIEKYGSTSSGQSLAGILGEALEKKDQKKD
tara:strand:- start:1778 stop:3496 length:1719 start_codon:yes stop_codon:yes gene_type:complete